MKLLALLLVFLLRRIEAHDVQATWRTRLDRLLLSPLSVTDLFTRVGSTRLLLLVSFWAGIGFLLRFCTDDWLLGWFLLAIYAGLLWILLGRDRLGPDINEYLRLWYLHDAGEAPGKSPLGEFARARFGVTADSVAAMHGDVLRAIFLRAFHESFLWIVVFAVTGIPGLLALAALDASLRALDVHRDEVVATIAAEMRERIDWLAVRLLAMTFLLTGNSGRAWPMLDSRLLDDEDPAGELMADIGVAAAALLPPAEGETPDVGLDITDVRSLLLRTQVVWTMLMAVSVIVGF